MQNLKKMQETGPTTPEQKTAVLYTIGALIRDSVSLVRGNFRILLEITLPLVLLELLFLFYPVEFAVQDKLSLSAILPPVLIVLLRIVAGSVFSIAQILALDRLSENKPVSMGEILNAAVEKYFPYLWVIILSGLAILGGFVLLIIPGIIFGIWFGFSSYALLLENRSGVSALRRSRQLVSGNSWYIFVISFVISLVFWTTAYLSAGILWAFFNLAAKTPLNSFDAFTALTVPIATIPFYAVFVLLFKNLRGIKGDRSIALPYRLTAEKK